MKIRWSMLAAAPGSMNWNLNMLAFKWYLCMKNVWHYWCWVVLVRTWQNSVVIHCIGTTRCRSHFLSLLRHAMTRLALKFIVENTCSVVDTCDVAPEDCRFYVGGGCWVFTKLSFNLVEKTPDLMEPHFLVHLMSTTFLHKWTIFSICCDNAWRKTPPYGSLFRCFVTSRHEYLSRRW